MTDQPDKLPEPYGQMPRYVSPSEYGYAGKGVILETVDVYTAAQLRAAILAAKMEERNSLVLTDQMIRAALAVQWPALYREGLFTEHDGPEMRRVTESRIDLIRKQWTAMLSAAIHSG